MAQPFQGFLQRFPQDIISKIFDDLHDDPPTLSNCSLVDSTFMEFSRMQTFSEVTISHHNARGFLDLLSSTACTFTGTTRSLEITLVPGSQKWFSDFSRRLARLTGISITTLKLSSSSRLAPVQEEVVTAIPAFYPSLRQIDIGQVTFTSATNLMDMISKLANLEGFACAASYQTEAGSTSFQQIQPQYSVPAFSISLQSRDILPFTPSLRRLALVSVSIEYCLDYLARKNALNNITSLSLISLTLGGLAVLSVYLASPHLSLQHLSIRMDNTSVASGVSTDVLFEKLNLSNLTVLREITIEAFPALSPNQAHRLLNGITSDDLAYITLNLALAQGAAAVDVTLTNTQRFPSLKRVYILGSAWADVRQHLPRCHARQILYNYSD